MKVTIDIKYFKGQYDAFCTAKIDMYELSNDKQLAIARLKQRVFALCGGDVTFRINDRTA